MCWFRSMVKDVVYIDNEYYSVMKKGKCFTFAVTWMDLEGFMPGEISQTQKDRYCMIPLIRGI